MNLAIFGEDVEEYVKYRNTLRDNAYPFYLLIWRQCISPTRAKLGAVSNYKKINKEKDSAAILREINGISYKYDSHRDPYLALNNAKSKFYLYSQKENKTNTVHFNTFKAVVGVVEHQSSSIANDETLINLEIRKSYPKLDVDTVKSN